MKYDVIIISMKLLAKRGLKVADVDKKPADHFEDKKGSNSFSLVQCENKCIKNFKTVIPFEMQAVFDYIKHG
ncbi:MAG: hypothetical protein ACYCWE_16090 [Eubacteriales bacterium]